MTNGALPPETVANLTCALDRVATTLPTSSKEDRARYIVFEKHDSGQEPFIIGDLCRWSSSFRQLLSNEFLVRHAQAALNTKSLSAHLMNATIKHPHIGRRIAWHRDFPNRYITSPASDHMRIMVCLDGMAVDGGATRFIPGSHLISDEAARSASDARHELDPYAGEVAVCEPGSFVLIHPKVLHGSPINDSGKLRRNIVIQVGTRDARVIGEKESITGLPLRIGLSRTADL